MKIDSCWEPCAYDQKLLCVDDIISPVAEMTQSERLFLNKLVCERTPRKSLEIGVSAGASSAVILNGITSDSLLYSIDLGENWYVDPQKKSGFLVSEKFPQLMDKWRLHTGGYAIRFLDDIGDGIEFCLLDTAHTNPGEILDFLMVLPYLAKNCMLVIHDISVYSCYACHHDNKFHAIVPYAATCGILFSAIRGYKTKQASSQLPLPNIGAVVLEDDPFAHLDDLFHLLTLPWYKWVPSREELSEIGEFIHRHYGTNYYKFFLKIIDAQEKMRNAWDPLSH